MVKPHTFHDKVTRIVIIWWVDRLDKILISFLVIALYADDNSMIYGIKYYNDLLMQAGPEGNVQSEMILRKDTSTFTWDHGWAFPRKVYFNGDECTMSPPDKYPSLPSIAPSNRSLASALAFFLILVLMPLILWCERQHIYSSSPSTCTRDDCEVASVIERGWYLWKEKVLLL